jgi:ankyrin repeat protein
LRVAWSTGRSRARRVRSWPAHGRARRWALWAWKFALVGRRVCGRAHGVGSAAGAENGLIGPSARPDARTRVGMAALSSEEARRSWERAIEADDEAAVAAAIASGARVNGDDRGRPLHYAAERGKLAAFRALLAAGADAAATDSGRSIVYAALLGGHAALLREAISAREAVAPQLPPLHVAAAADDDGAAVVAMLVSGEAGDVNAEAGRADFGVTAMHVAALCGNVGAIRAVAAAGGRVDMHCGDGGQPVHFAARGGQISTFHVLLQLGSDVDVPSFHARRQPMHEAAKCGHVDTIRALAELGCSVDAADNMRRQPMHLAAEGGHVGAIRVLVELGGRVDAADTSGSQPMHEAAWGGHVGAILTLVELGGRTDAADDSGRQPIHRAALNDHVDAVRALIHLGARIDATDNNGRQPMHWAAEGGSLNCVRVLAGLGAPIHSPDVRGWCPLHWAGARGHAALVSALCDLGAQIHSSDRAGSTVLHHAASVGASSVIVVALTQGADVTTANKKGETALHIAVQRGFTSAAALLLERSAMLLSLSDAKSSTPLHHSLSFFSQQLDTALWLITAGAPTSARDSAGATPLHLAAAIPSKPVVLALLAAGADPTIQDNEGRYAIQRVPNTTRAPITGDPVKEAIVDALQSAMHAVFAARGAGSLPAWLGTLRGSVRRLLLPMTAEEAITPAQIAAATVDAAAVTWDRGADGHLVRLGGGTFGAVYAGTLRLADGGVAAVALKQVLVASPSAAGGAASATADQQDGAFWREVVVHHGCSSHEGIVRCHGGFVRERDGVRERVIVLDRCVGSLADALHGRVVDAATQRRDPATARAVTPAQRLTWARQLVAALAYLHGRDIVHGDVKSENVLLDGDGNVRLSDLGGAALRREENAAAADAAHMGERGSPAYMCPALGLGRAPLSKASDVYSCGVLLWEVLSGVLPYGRGEAVGVASAAQLYGAVVEGARPGSGAELSGLAPRGVGDWIAAMWHPHPRMRPPLEDVAEALRVLCGGAERLPEWRWEAGWAASFGVSAAAGARTRLAAGLVAPVVGAAAVPPAPAAIVPPLPVVHDPAVIAAALGQLRLDDLAFDGTRGGSA